LADLTKNCRKHFAGSICKFGMTIFAASADTPNAQIIGCSKRSATSSPIKSARK
jgi:hypothetical protein